LEDAAGEAFRDLRTATVLTRAPAGATAFVLTTTALDGDCDTLVADGASPLLLPLHGEALAAGTRWRAARLLAVARLLRAAG